MGNESGKVGGDKRARLRAPLLVLKVRVDDGAKAFFGYAKNISRSGLFIATTNPRDPGSRFQVEVPLPAPLKRTIRCTCEVVWKRDFTEKSTYEPGMGLKFIDMPEEISEAIHQWVKGTEQPPPKK